MSVKATSGEGEPVRASSGEREYCMLQLQYNRGMSQLRLQSGKVSQLRLQEGEVSHLKLQLVRVSQLSLQEWEVSHLGLQVH